jgi:hypothetical protein
MEIQGGVYTLSFTRILHESTYLLFYSQNDRLYGAYEILKGDVQWKHIYAQEYDADFEYKLKDVKIKIEKEGEKIFGPQTAASLKRRLDGSENRFFISI